MKEPESMEQVIYFTNRAIGTGNATAWVFKGECPECNAMMGKPKGDDGKVKIRAKEYVCEKCNHTEEKTEYEERLTANIKYTCPKCSHEGETQIPYKRKTFQGAKALVFECSSCAEKIPITKKMKKTKK